MINCIISQSLVATESDPSCARLYRTECLRLIPYLLRVADQDSQNPKVVPVHGCVGWVAGTKHEKQDFVRIVDGAITLENGWEMTPRGLFELTWSFTRLHVASLEDAVYGGIQEANHVRRTPDLPTTWSSLVGMASLFWKLIMDPTKGKCVTFPASRGLEKHTGSQT